MKKLPTHATKPVIVTASDSCGTRSSALRPTKKTMLISTVMPLLFVGFATALPAQAQAEGGKFELSPFAGYHIFESKQNLEDALTYGVRLGYSLSPNWSIEGAVSFVGSNVDDTFLASTRKGQFSSPMTDVDLTLYQLDALYHFMPRGKFSPYLVGGYGATDYSPSISDKDMSTFNLGVGAKYWLAEKVAVRFDLRDHFVSEVFDDGFQNLSATLGITFAFGGKAKSAPAYTAMNDTGPAPQQVTPEDDKVIALEFEDIHFDFDQSLLTNEAKTILKRSVTRLQESPKSRVRIAGYTSESGTAAYNQGLSERRATAVRDYLIERGVSRNRLSTIGYGETRPVSHEATPSTLNSAAAKENMRALFEIVIQ